MRFDTVEMINKIKYDPRSVKREKKDDTTDLYLARVSYRYAYFCRIFAVILVILTVAFLLSGTLSYKNLYYLVKDVSLSSEYVRSVHDTVTYNVGSSQSFALYREGIAVASRERFSIFAVGGRELFSSNQSYANPALYTSDKYVLLCDVGGRDFSVYNSFSRAREETLSHTIYGACASKEGDFAIITGEEKYTSCVKVYKSNGKEFSYNFSSGKVVAASLSDDGRKLAVVLAFADGDGFSCEIRAYGVGSDDYESAALSFSGLVYGIKHLENGSIAAVGARGVNVFTSNLDLLGEYLPENEIYAYAFGDDNIAVSHIADRGAKNAVVCLDSRAKVRRSIASASAAISLEICDGYVFVQRIDGFERTSILTGKTERIEMPAGSFKMICADKDTLVIFAQSYSKFLSFK